ncbi:peptidoglycan DD-metalloendopeptidase family protein [Jeotgalicoccus halotolerans]|uniref:peptidoglycan DD-metalloendopeptidase family protein n=1 Tax=Jeotgalicoccus halotolerans TaxID=157227 RepID=UPI0035117C47
MALRDAERAFANVNEEVSQNRKEMDNAEIALKRAETDYNKLARSVDHYTQEMKEMHIEQTIANSAWTKSGDAVIGFSNQLEKVSGMAVSVGNSLTRSITMPALGVVTAVGGIVGAFGWGRLVSIDSAQAQLLGLGYTAEDVERISEQLTEALEGGMLTMGEATSAAATAMAAGVEEGEELTRYIQILDGAVAGSNGTFEEMEQIFGRVTDQGNMTRNEFDMIAQRMPGFSKAVQDNMKISSEEMYEMLRNGEITTADFLDIMEDFAGDMAEAYAQSWEGMLANTTAYVGILGQNLLQGVFQMSKEELADFIELLKSDEAIKWAKETGTVLRESFITVRDAVKDTVDWYQNLDDWQRELIIKAGMFAVAVGPVLTIIGKLGGGIAVLGKAFGGLLKFIGVGSGTNKALASFGKTATTAGVAVAGKSGTGGLLARIGLLGGGFAKAGGAVALLSNPVGWLVGGLAALGGGFVLAYNKVDWFRNVIDLAWDSSMIFFDTINEITGMNALVDWFGDSWQSTEDFRNKVGETMGNVTDWIGDTFNEYIKEPFENFKAMHREAGETVEVFDGDVSEATQSVLESYVTLSEEAKLALDTLYYSQEEVTQAMVDDVVTKYQAMHDEAAAKMEERREMEIGKLTELLEETESITESDREYRLKRAEEHFNTEEQQLTEVNERIQQIISDALSTEEGLQEEHYIAIEELQNNHNLQTVETLSQGELEQQTIIERMKTNQLATSEETVKQLIADAKNAKEQTVSEAVQKRDDTIAEAIRQRDETGLISAEEADKIIAEAEREYLESVDKAESRYGEVLTIAQNQASEHGIIVDGETGDILSKWDLFAVGLEAALGAISTMAGDKATQIGNSIKAGIAGVINWLIEDFNKIPAALGSDFRLPTITLGSASANLGWTPYSNGTDYHMGGTALLGDKGPGNGTGGGGLGSASNTREIVELPNQKRYLVDGNVIWPNFPIGAKVKNNKDTEKELSTMGVTGGSGSLLMTAPILTGPTLAGQNKVIQASHTFGEMVRNIYDYLDDPAALIHQLMSEANLPGVEVVSEIGGGMLNKLTQPLIDKVTSLFEAVSSTGDGSHILSKKILQFFGRYGMAGASGGLGIGFNGGNHYGIDTAHYYDPLLSPVNGQVTRTWNDYGGGNSIEIKSGRDYWWFMHLSKILTSVGDSVKAGQRIGTTGNTGNFVVGSGHLHTQYMPGAPGNANAEDPLPVLRRLSNKGSFENGGIISSHGYYEGAEGNKPEMVIPLTNRSRAIDLMFQAMSLMGGGNNQQQNPSISNSLFQALIQELKELKEINKQANHILNLIFNKDIDIILDGESIKLNMDEREYDQELINRLLKGRKKGVETA